jgi:hypothetical protein
MVCLKDLLFLLNSLCSQWGFEKLVFRNSISCVRRDRKYAIQAKNAYATGVHMSENVIGNTTHKTEHLIRHYHYHNTINVQGEVCREFASTTQRWPHMVREDALVLR